MIKNVAQTLLCAASTVRRCERARARLWLRCGLGGNCILFIIFGDGRTGWGEGGLRVIAYHLYAIEPGTMLLLQICCVCVCVLAATVVL